LTLKPLFAGAMLKDNKGLKDLYLSHNKILDDGEAAQSCEPVF
jgi:hypothetical protein